MVRVGVVGLADYLRHRRWMFPGLDRPGYGDGERRYHAIGSQPGDEVPSHRNYQPGGGGAIYRLDRRRDQVQGRLALKPEQIDDGNNSGKRKTNGGEEASNSRH